MRGTGTKGGGIAPSGGGASTTGGIGKDQRYETKLERQLYRAMAQLERIQRMRQGETVPAPVAVAVA